MKLKLKLLTVFMFSLCLFLFMGCQQEVETINDTTAPAEVTELSVTYDNSITRLTWTNPSDKDFVGVQISMEPAEGLLANPISLGASVTSFTLTGLRTDVTYVVTIKTFDSKFNYSEGVSKNVKISGNQGGNDNPTPTPGGEDDPTGGENEQPENTDTIPPAQVENLVAEYSAAENSITVSWTNPLETDFSGTKVVYGKTNSSEKTTLTYDKSFSSIVIPGIVADDSEYTIFVSTTDTSGNLSEARSVTVQAVNNEIVECDVRTGDYVLSNNTYVRKEYYSELTQEERNSIVGIVLVTDSAEPLILGTKFPSTELAWTTTPTGTDTYFTDIAVQVTASWYDYTFTGDVDGSDNWGYICEMDTVGTANEATTYPTFYYANMYPNVAGLTNSDFADGWYVPSVSELWQAVKYLPVIQNSLTTLGVELPATYTSSVLTCSSFWSSSQSYNFDKSAYKIDYETGEITTASRALNNYVWVFHKFDAKKITKYEYGTPEISSVVLEASKIGETYSGSIPVTIHGNNLIGYEFESPDSYLYAVACISNTEAKGYISFDDTVGNHVVTINCGTASGSTAYDVIESEKCFAVGDILFTDGTRMKAENVKYGVPDSQAAKAFGVIGRIPYGGAKGYAVGLHKSSSYLQWAPSGTRGYITNFTEIQGTAISGDMDGSDNWEYICSVDPTGTADAATNYPAFNFANTYGTIAGLTGTEYENGWYLPSVAELYDVYENEIAVQESLAAVNGFNLTSGYYWSSSQVASDYDDAYRVNFGYGDVGSNSTKDDNYNVFVLQAFNSELFNNYEVTTTPSITSVSIPTVGEGYTGELPVTIVGTNLKGHAITSSDASFTNITYLTDIKVTATITCNGVVGTTEVTVNCAGASCIVTLKVVAAEKCFNIGDIILTDGSKVAVDDVSTYTILETNKPIGVITSVQYGGATGKAVGLQKSSSTLGWARGITGYTNFTEIQAGYDDYDSIGGNYTNYVFTGDFDGSDNWAYICSVDPEGTADAATNYPAFNFAVNYGETAGLTGTQYETGWYIPSVAELYDICMNRGVVQKSLDAAGGFTIGRNYYWSSSQDTFDSRDAYKVYFNDGRVLSDHKSYSNNVLVVQAFYAQ